MIVARATLIPTNSVLRESIPLPSSRPVVDLRSDTVTRPTPGMRQAMAEAEVDDDVIGHDPTVQRLEERIASLLGKEAGLFMPTGTMSNQIALRLHCLPGDEFLCESGCHIYNYEQGAFAQLSGLVGRTLIGEGGLLRRDHFEGQIHPDDEHFTRTRLVTLENTHNRGAGAVQPQDDIVAICDWAREHQLQSHLDGARLFNASVATGLSLAQLSKPFDTVSVCFSKGLGAPVGSALVGSTDAMRIARRHRKVLGGAMRQSGVLAAAALYGIEHHIERLSDDHARAQQIGDAVRTCDGLQLVPDRVDSNIVIFQVDPRLGTARDLIDRWGEKGVAALSVSSQGVRAVTHLDVDGNQIDHVVSSLKSVVGQMAGERVRGS